MFLSVVNRIELDTNCIIIIKGSKSKMATNFGPNIFHETVFKMSAGERVGNPNVDNSMVLWIYVVIKYLPLHIYNNH